MTPSAAGSDGSGDGRAPRRNRRLERHEATRREILDTAWAMVRDEGLAALSLRGLARTLGMEAQSLYTYFPSKHAIYDGMFAEANAALLERRRALPAHGGPVEQLADATHAFVEFCVEDPVRYQLLFLRTIPGFEPSPDSYASARENLDLTRARLAAVGVASQLDVDLYTAMFSGLVSQQIANDPGGNRWTRQVDRVIEMYLEQVATTVGGPPRGDGETTEDKRGAAEGVQAERSR